MSQKQEEFNLNFKDEIMNLIDEVGYDDFFAKGY